MTDSRVEKLAASYGPAPLPPADDHTSFAAASIRKIEAAGLTVLDLDDPALPRAMAEAVARHWSDQFVELNGGKGRAWADIPADKRERAVNAQMSAVEAAIVALRGLGS